VNDISFFPDLHCWIGASRYDKINSSALPTFSSTMAPMTFVGENKGAEVNIPYYHNFKYEVSHYNNPNLGLAKLDIFTDSDPGEVSCVIYHSFGPDIRATCFRQVPGVLFRTAPVGTWTTWFF